ncbi:hypothetical protein CMI37_28975 [Candidatus Pacearchaeota archaeon]|nr:hypothetical protein [Candidatus Pacearchaeota archaeon]
MAENVDNLQGSNPTSGSETGLTADGFTSEDFFSSLDAQVNGMITGAAPSPKPRVEEKSETKNSKPSKGNSELGKEYTKLEKRYKDSSREAVRLNQRNQELERGAPILDRMRQDPAVAEKIKNVINGTDIESGDMKKAFNLPEDFVFDADEAISTPTSDSAKVLNGLVDSQVQKRVSQFAQQYSDKMDKSREITEFVKRHKMSRDEYKDFVNYAQSRPLSLDDIHTLMNLEKRDANIAENTRMEMKNQMENVRKKPASVASSGNVPQSEQTADEMVFEAIKGSSIEGLEGLQ